MHRHPERSASRPIAWGIVAVSASLLLTGCGAALPAASPTPTATASSPTPTATPTPTPTVPTLDPDGPASANLAYFKGIVREVAGSSDKVTGRAYIDALVEGGFDKNDMQLTPDSTTVGNPAESIQFSVLWGEECLVGQVGPATGKPVAVVLPAVGGACLIGETRPIDW